MWGGDGIELQAKASQSTDGACLSEGESGQLLNLECPKLPSCDAFEGVSYSPNEQCLNVPDGEHKIHTVGEASNLHRSELADLWDSSPRRLERELVGDVLPELPVDLWQIVHSLEPLNESKAIEAAMNLHLQRILVAAFTTVENSLVCITSRPLGQDKPKRFEGCHGFRERPLYYYQG
jgi:hypothetical protein